MKHPETVAMLEDPRPDYIDKVTGTAIYASDVVVPGMLHGKVLRSTVPHAKILSIDVSAAEAMPGVVAVLTGADLPALGGSGWTWGLGMKDRPVIAVDKVRYVGDPVVAVAAVSEFIAEEAIETICVEYDTLPFVTTCEEAMAPDAPLVHVDMEKMKDFYFKGEPAPVTGTNIFHHHRYASGDVDAAFGVAARVFEDTFSFPMVFHYAMEPHVCIADCRSDSLELWSCGQTPAAIQRVCSDVLGIPMSRVRVHSPYVGGGFGGKASVKIDPLVAVLSWKAKKPVRVCLGIAESMLTCRRLSADVTLKTAVDGSGRITAKSVRILMNGGAYADTGAGIAGKSANRAIGPYHIPNLKLEALAVYTNTVPGGAFRSIGGPQAVWATESQMDMMAAALGFDPVEFRLLNMAEKGQTIRPDLRPLDVDMKAALRLCVEEMKTFGNPGPYNRPGVLRGVAVAATDPGGSPVGGATVRMKVDGSVLIAASTVEIGQGNRGVLRAIASERLRQNVSTITVAEPDTSLAPYDWGTGASRSTVIVGLAVQYACDDILQQIAQVAAHLFGGAAADYHLVEGAVIGNGKQVPLCELLRRLHGIDSGEFLGVGRVTALTKDGNFGLAPLFWETASGICEIDLDLDTGDIRLSRYVGATDVGCVINRKAAEGQDEGAMIMGLGHSLTEQYIYEDGQVINGTLFDYHVPTIDESPLEVRTLLIESGDGPGPNGSRGMGEGALLPMAPAIGNALFWGHGIRIKTLPLTAERVWRALQDARKTTREL